MCVDRGLLQLVRVRGRVDLYVCRQMVITVSKGEG